MRIKIALSISVILVLSTPGFAKSLKACESPYQPLPISKLQAVLDDARCTNVDTSDEAYRTFLKSLLSPHLKTTDREVSFYHFGQRASSGKIGFEEIINLPSKDGSYDGPVETNEKDAQNRSIGEQYFRNMASNYSQKNDFDWELGRGLYTASEPFSSLAYAKPPGFLLEIKIPSGTNYLDLRPNPRKLKITEAQFNTVYCYLKKDGISPKDLEYFDQDAKRFGPRLDIKRLIKTDQSRKIYIDLLRSMKVDMITSEYGPFAYPECKINPKAGFMTMGFFINPDLADRAKFSTYALKLEDHPNAKKRADYARLLKYFEAIDCREKDNRAAPCVEPNDRDRIQFEQLYRDWASKVYDLPADTDFVKLRNEKSAQIRSTRSSQVSSTLFGCDPGRPQEIQY